MEFYRLSGNPVVKLAFDVYHPLGPEFGIEPTVIFATFVHVVPFDEKYTS